MAEKPRGLAAQLVDRLRAHYIKPSAPGGQFAHEVGINGDTSVTRRCDAVYVGFTNASGRLMVGHEVKVSRSDWLHELDQADKADFWADQCHAWYVVVPAAGIVKPGELPHGWGLMRPNPRSRVRFDVVVPSEVKLGHAPSWLAVRSVMARLDTLAQQGAALVAQEALTAARAQVAKEAEARLRHEGVLEPLTPDIRRRLDQLDNLERYLGQKLGHSMDSVSPSVAAWALRLVITHGDGIVHALRGFRNSRRYAPVANVLQLASQLDSELGKLEKLATDELGAGYG